MKRILFLTPFVPSNKAGGENFTRQLLIHLSEYFKVDLLYYKYEDDPQYVCPNENIKIVKEIVNSTKLKLLNILRNPCIHPILSVRFNKKILKFIQDLVKESNYDLMFLDHSQMALYGEYFPDMKKILMSHDVMAQRYSRRGNWLSKKIIINGEKRVMRQKNLVVYSFSEKDRGIIKEMYGIDSKVTHFFLDKCILEAMPTAIEKRIVFFGKWKRIDNFEGLKWFFDNVYDCMEKSIEIDIIGNWLPDDFRKRIASLKNVKYLGFIDNPYPLIANSIATVSPLFSGAGVKVKVVESIACGTPVIGTDIAFEGLHKKYSKMMLWAEYAESYVKAMTVEMSIEERVRFKQDFIKDYNSETIPQFLLKYLQ